MTEEEIQKILGQAVRDYPHRLHLLEPLIRHFYGKIKRFAYLRLRDEFWAEDVAQNVFGRLLASLRTFQPERSFRAWLYQIARNEIARLAKQKKKEPESMEPQSISEQAFLHEGEDTKDKKIYIEDILAKMQPEYESILRLYYIDDLKIADLCAILDISPSLAKMRLLRAREQFARLWNQKP